MVLPGAFVLLLNPLFAQPTLCEDPCPPGPAMTEKIDFCHFSWVGHVYDSILMKWNPQTLTNIPYLSVIVNYRLRDCDGAVIIDSYVYIDYRDYWQNIWPTDYMPGAQVQPPVATAFGPCTFETLPPDSLVNRAIHQLLQKFNSPQSQVAVYFKGACFSWVRLSFPSGAFWMQEFDIPGGGTRWDTVRFTSNSPVWEMIPCIDSACCKVTFTQTPYAINNGVTETYWKALYYESYGNCEVQELPDYNQYQGKFVAMMHDQLTGSTYTMNGTVEEQTDCQLTCPMFCPAWIPEPHDRVTGIAAHDAPLEFSIHPTVVDDLIHVTSNKSIKKVLVYDLSGRIALSTSASQINEIDASGLARGAYLVQVHFENNEMRSAKILKQ
jgi:hypothetical protein